MQDPVSQNVDGVQQLVGSRMNKIPYATSTQEGVEGEIEDALTLDLPDEDLLALADAWTNKYRMYEGKIEPRQKLNKQFYLGTQNQGSSTVAGEPIAANLLFEAEETFLPAALAKNPEPVVWADNTEEGNKLAKEVKSMLQYHSDTLVLRSKLKLMARQWSIYLIGVMKHGWDSEVQDIKSEIRRPQNFIFDPEGFVNCYGDYEGYLGERVTVTAEKLIEKFPAHEEYISGIAEGKLGTDVIYTEWWSPDDKYCFYTFKNKVLDKHKNEFFNYGKDEEEEDEDGEIQKITREGANHFARPKKPYTFLSVFSLEEQPHDMTSLIEQNIPNQRRVTRRTEQIDYNLSRANNSDVFSENNFNQETATQASRALAKGNPIIVPKGGPITEAIHRLQAPGLDASFFKELEVSKQDLRQIFGTQGMTSNPQDDDKTVRGKIINAQHDTTRIGGGIGDALEQVADNIFNWWVQLYYVFYDEEHAASIMGGMKAVEYVEISSQNLDRKLVISVSPNSMKPKDETTEMNQALALWESGAMDPKTLLTILDFPDPQATAENVVLWSVDKASYMQLNFPELMQKIQEAQMQMQQAAMNSAGAAGAGGIMPEAANGEPAQPIEAAPANPALNQVPITNQGLPQ